MCRSVNAPEDRDRRHYARYYSLDLAEAMHVRIGLSGADILTDEHLFLLAGTGTTGAVVASDVETADAATDRAYLELVVEPGAYTIEAASGHLVDGSYEREDDFTLTIDAFPTSPSEVPAGCLRSVGTVGGQLVAARDGRWSRGDLCRSVNAPEDRDRRHYARYFSFSVPEAMHVRIGLNGAQTRSDEYLYVLAGVGTTGAVVASNVELEDEVDDLASIGRVFEPGAYTIETTTTADLEDDFTLTIDEIAVALPRNCVEAPGSACPVPVLAGAVLNDGATVDLIYQVPLNESSIPELSAFSVSVDGSDRSVTAVTVRDRAVSLTLASPVSAPQSVTVTYAVPTAAGHPRIESAGGPAVGFSDEPVTTPPDPPTITRVESTTEGLTISWTPVAGISGYDVEWRRDGETAWQLSRVGAQQQHTLGGLTSRALYWVRIRAIKTHEDLGGPTTYATGWSALEPGIAGDWAPQNLTVTPGDRILTATWDDVDAATDDYELQWRPKSAASASAVSGSPSTRGQRRGDSATARNVLEPPPTVPAPAWSSVPVESVAQAWSGTVTNLQNGENYSVRVQSLRRVVVDAGEPTQRIRLLRSGWVERDAAPTLSFSVAEITPLGVESFARGGNPVRLLLRFVHGTEGDNANAESLAQTPLGALFESGPSHEAGVGIECIRYTGIFPGVSEVIGSECVTNSLGYVRLTYTVGAVGRDVEGWSRDTVRIFIDQNANGEYDESESYAEFTVPIAEPIDYVALGDSYSAGENGEYYTVGGFGTGFAGQYYYTNGASSDCHRWNKAYPVLVANSDLNVNQRTGFPGTTPGGPPPIGFYACTGAITRNIYHPMDTNNDGVPDQLGTAEEIADSANPKLIAEATTLAATQKTEITNRPSSVDLIEEFDWQQRGNQHSNWEPRQVVSLGAANAVRPVDLVTLTVGGNDLGFAEGLTRCFFPDVPVGYFPFFLSDLVLGSVRCARDSGFETRLGDLREGLRDVLGELLEATSDAPIFVFGYPNLVPHDDRACSALTAEPIQAVWNSDGFGSIRQFVLGLVGDHDVIEDVSLSATDRQFIREAAMALNDAIGDEVTSANSKAVREGLVPRVHFVDVMGRFEGHSACGDRVADGDESAASRSSADGLWLNGVVGDARSSSAFPMSGRSFHPTAAGHQAYASALIDYIRQRIASGARVTSAGLPDAGGAPSASAGGRATRTGEGGGGIPSASARGKATRTGDGGGDRLGRSQSSPDATSESEKEEQQVIRRRILWARPAEGAASGCGVLWSPAERVEFSTAGFAADSTVTFSVTAGTLSRRDGSAAGASLDPPVLASATADGEGRLAATWTLPTAPHASTPAWYAVKAEGDAAGGGRLVARLVAPIVVYPGAQPCSADDVATTTLGTAVRVAVLANDTAPTGGALDPASVTVEPVGGVEFVVNPADGSVTFTPEPGFAGTATTRYVAYDTWNVGIRAEVSVTVVAGCTITGGVPDGSGAVVEVIGTDGDDVICVGDRTDRRARYRVDAKAGDDVILAGAGADVVLGGPGVDVIYGRGGDDRLDGGAGVDTIHGGGGFDSIYSADLADVIVDADDGYELVLTPVLLSASPDGAVAPVVGADAVFAEPGGVVLVNVLDNDFDADGNLDAPSLAVTRAPRLGDALVFASVQAGLVVRYAAGEAPGADDFAYEICDTLGACATGEVTVTVGTSSCTIVGTDGDDVLAGTPGADVICGLGGDDVIRGRGGNDILVGGSGDDELLGGDGDDVLHGGSGDDDLYGGAGADVLWGGAGRDALEGNGGDDVLHGGPGVDGLIGGGGADVLWGGDGGDSLIGHAGNDTLHGGQGNDILVGGNGDDSLWGDAGDDRLTGSSGADTLTGGDGNDTLWGNTQHDALVGGNGDDTLHGGGGNDELNGGAGDDTLAGNAGDDRLYGSWGDDNLTGGNGADFLHGGDGADTCSRGPLVARCED